MQAVGCGDALEVAQQIHPVDHVEGTLAEPFVALDGFLSHAWAVTLIGAPRQAAIQCLEAPEKSLRDWYGGAIGLLGFNGDMNTGLTLRAARIVQGMAQVRVGATLLLDSDLEAEVAGTLALCLARQLPRGDRRALARQGVLGAAHGFAPVRGGAVARRRRADPAGQCCTLRALSQEGSGRTRDTTHPQPQDQPHDTRNLCP